MAKRTLLTDSQVRKALEVYVDRRLHADEFALLLDLSVAAARQILSRKTWKHIPCPPGFQYPWPEYAAPERGAGAEKMAEAFERASEERWTKRELAAFLGRSIKGIDLLIEGYIYKNIPRPENFNVGTEVDRETERVREAFWLCEEKVWTRKQLREHLGYSHSRFSALARGQIRKDIPRPSILLQDKKK